MTLRLMHPALDRVALALIVVAVARVAAAAPILADRATALASRWAQARTVLRPKSALRTAVQNVRTVRDAASQSLFHVVKIEDSGFVIVAPDDEMTPVIAFAGGREFVEDARNPLWEMLNRDLPMRLAILEKRRQMGKLAPAAGQKVVVPSSVVRSSSVRSGALAVDDVRVEPLLASRWDQEGVGAKDVYNYHTPDGTPCGCVATAAAQVMRYHEFPDATVARRSYSCTVKGRAHDLTTIGGTYDWSLMPLVPDDSISDEACEMIGRLTYDVGVASCMSYSTGGSGTFGYYTEKAFKELFHYAQAVYADQLDTKRGVMDKLADIMLANLDAGLPVMMGISGKDRMTRKNVGHEIVGDGYGYIDSDLYVHLNLGWSGSWDAWYNLPNIDAYEGYSGCEFNLFDDVVYNILPCDGGEIVSGRVLGQDGVPISEARVIARAEDGSVVAEATTTEHGIYAVLLPCNGTFSLKANFGLLEGSPVSASTGESATYAPSFNECHAPSFAASVGNRWGVDIVLESGTCAMPRFGRESCSFVDSLAIDCSCDDSEAEVRYTVDGSEPTWGSAVWPASGLVLTGTTTVRACAFRRGMVKSPVATATYYDRPVASLKDGVLSWKCVEGASCYRIYRSTNRFGLELEPCSEWIGENSLRVAAPPSVDVVYFYFVRASAVAADDFASPLSDAMLFASFVGPQDDGSEEPTVRYAGLGGGNFRVFVVEDFPCILPTVYYSNVGQYGEDGSYKVTVPTTSRKGIPLEENVEIGEIKTTKVISQTKFDEAYGELVMGSNAGNAEPRAWRTKLWFVKNDVTNFVGESSLRTEPTCLHFFQQCEANFSLGRMSGVYDGEATNDHVAVTCAREYEWTASCDADWVKVLRPQGRGSCVLRFALEHNEGDEPRTATVTVRCDGREQTFAIVQQTGGETPRPIIDDDIALLATQGDRETSVFLHWTSVQGMVSYEIYRSISPDATPDRPYWVSSNSIPALVDFRVTPGSNYYYTVVANTVKGRTKPSNCAMGYAMPAVTPSQASVSLAPEGGTNRVVVLSNAGWWACTDAQWLTLEAMDIERNGVLDISAERNPKAVPRSATILLVGGRDGQHPVTNSIAVVQAAGVNEGRSRGSADSREGASVCSDEIPDGDPTVRVVMEMIDGKPKVSWHSDLPESARSEYEYIILGRESLGPDSKWKPLEKVDEQTRSAMRFFRVMSRHK